MIGPEINVHQQQPQFEQRERQLVSKFTWYVKTKPAATEYYSDIEADDEMDVNIGTNISLTTVWLRNIASIKCIGYVGKCNNK